MTPQSWWDFEKIWKSWDFRPQNPRFGAKHCPEKPSKIQCYSRQSWVDSRKWVQKFKNQQKFLELSSYAVDAIDLSFCLVQVSIIYNGEKKGFLIFSIFSILLEQFSHKITWKTMPKHDILHSEPKSYVADKKSSQKYRKNQKTKKKSPLEIILTCTRQKLRSIAPTA